MESHALVSAVLRGESTPRPVCGPLATFFCAVDAGVSLHDFTLNPNIHADCVVRAYEKYRPDALWISTIMCRPERR